MGGLVETGPLMRRATVLRRRNRHHSALRPDILEVGPGPSHRLSQVPLAHDLRRGVRKGVGSLFSGSDKDGTLYEHIVSLAEGPLLQAVLDRVGGNQLKAAELLGINRNTLRKRMRQLGITGKRESAGGGDPGGGSQ